MITLKRAINLPTGTYLPSFPLINLNCCLIPVSKVYDAWRDRGYKSTLTYPNIFDVPLSLPPKLSSKTTHAVNDTMPVTCILGFSIGNRNELQVNIGFLALTERSDRF